MPGMRNIAEMGAVSAIENSGSVEAILNAIECIREKRELIDNAISALENLGMPEPKPKVRQKTRKTKSKMKDEDKPKLKLGLRLKPKPRKIKPIAKRTNKPETQPQVAMATTPDIDINNEPNEPREQPKGTSEGIKKYWKQVKSGEIKRKKHYTKTPKNDKQQVVDSEEKPNHAETNSETEELLAMKAEEELDKMPGGGQGATPDVG